MKSFVLGFTLVFGMFGVASATDCHVQQQFVQQYAFPIVVPQYFVAPPQVQLQQVYVYQVQQQEQRVQKVQKVVVQKQSLLSRIFNGRNRSFNLNIQRNVQR